MNPYWAQASTWRACYAISPRKWCAVLNRLREGSCRMPGPVAETNFIPGGLFSALHNPTRLEGTVFLRISLLFAAALLAHADLLVTSAFTDSVLRYDAATGAFLGTFIPSGSGGLDDPRGIVAAANGDILVSSFATDQILRYSSTGTFLGVSGDSSSGLNGPIQLAIGPANVLYAASSQSDAILRYDSITGASLGVFVSDITMPPLNTPRGLAVGNGRVYTSTEGDRIRYYDLATSMLLVSPLGDNPRGLTVSPSGSLLVAFAGPASQVNEYNGTTGAFIGIVVPHEGGGLLTPMGVGFGPDGNLYVASSGTNEILRYNPAGTFLDQFVAAGIGRPLQSAVLRLP